MNTRIQIIFITLLTVAQSLAQSNSFETQLQNVGKRLTEQLDKEGRKKLTILDIVELDGRDTAYGRFITEQMRIELITNKHSFVLVDDANRTRLIEQIRESNSGLFKTEDVKKLGKMAGADTVLFGKLAESGGKVYVTFTLSSTETGEIIGGAKMVFEKSEKDQVKGGGNSTEASASTQGKSQNTSDRKFTVKKAVWSQGPLEFTITNFLVIQNKAQAKVMVRNKSKATLRVGFDCDAGNSIGQGQAYTNGIPSTTGLNAKLNDSSGTKFYFAGVEGIISADYTTPVFYLSRNSDYSGSAAATVRSLSELPPNADLSATLYFVLAGGVGAVVGRNAPIALDMNFSLEASFWYSEERVGGITVPTRLTARFDDLRPKN